MANKLLLAMLAIAGFLKAEATTTDFSGPLPADNSGLRGYAMPAEGTHLQAPGTLGFDIGFDAANYWTYENAGSRGYVRQIFETQTLALGLRYGFNLGRQLEAGLKSSLRQSNEGFMNGAIHGFESGMASSLNYPYFKNPYRSGSQPLKGSSDQVRVGSRERRRDADASLGWGDTLLSLKTPLLERGLNRIAARLALNIPTATVRSDRAFGALGLSLDQPSPFDRLIFHADLRVLVPFESETDPGLSLAPLSLGASLGLEWRLSGFGFWVLRFPEAFSFGLQASATQSPYLPTGLRAYDALQNDLTFGFSHSFAAGSWQALLQIWGREDFFVRQEGSRALTDFLPYAPPDFQAGLKATFR